MRLLSWIVTAAFFAVLVAASLSLPPSGDPAAPAHRKESLVGSPTAGSYYLENAYPETHTMNIVTAVLADYRAFERLARRWWSLWREWPARSF